MKQPSNARSVLPLPGTVEMCEDVGGQNRPQRLNGFRLYLLHVVHAPLDVLLWQLFLFGPAEVRLGNVGDILFLDREAFPHSEFVSILQIGNNSVFPDVDFSRRSFDELERLAGDSLLLEHAENDLCETHLDP